jgi:predicted nucleotide-binding protein
MLSDENKLLYRKSFRYSFKEWIYDWSISLDGENIIHIECIGSEKGTYHLSHKYIFDLSELLLLEDLLNKFHLHTGSQSEIIWINNGSQCIELLSVVDNETNLEWLNISDAQQKGKIPLPYNYLQLFRGQIRSMQEIIIKRSTSIAKEEKPVLNSYNKVVQNSSLSGNQQRVFIVHGHAHGMKETVARFIEQLNLKTIILHEQVNRGKTIIEKFLEYSNVDYAVILLTGDDRGGIKDSLLGEQKKRARQNVILELGFFLGKLGREKVCTLYEEGVEVPTDYSGMVFIPLDDQESWKIKLVKEFKAAGLHIDTSKII